MDGPGYPIIPGDGLHFIMVVGITTIIMDGFGFLILNGDHHGLHGEEPMVIMAGNPWNQVLASALALAGTTMQNTITGYL